MNTNSTISNVAATVASAFMSSFNNNNNIITQDSNTFAGSSKKSTTPFVDNGNQQGKENDEGKDMARPATVDKSELVPLSQSPLQHFQLRPPPPSLSLLFAVQRVTEALAPLRLADRSWDNVGVLLEAPPPPPSYYYYRLKGNKKSQYYNQNYNFFPQQLPLRQQYSQMAPDCSSLCHNDNKPKIISDTPPLSLTVLLTIDLTYAVLREALDVSSCHSNVNGTTAVILAYHPPIFGSAASMPSLRYSNYDYLDNGNSGGGNNGNSGGGNNGNSGGGNNGNNIKQRILLEAAAAGISVYSPHTALDSCGGGLNDWLIEKCLYGGGDICDKKEIDGRKEPYRDYNNDGNMDCDSSSRISISPIIPDTVVKTVGIGRVAVPCKGFSNILEVCVSKYIETNNTTDGSIDNDYKKKRFKKLTLSQVVRNIKKSLGLSALQLALPPLMYLHYKMINNHSKCNDNLSKREEVPAFVDNIFYLGDNKGDDGNVDDNNNNNNIDLDNEIYIGSIAVCAGSGSSVFRKLPSILSSCYFSYSNHSPLSPPPPLTTTTTNNNTPFNVSSSTSTSKINGLPNVLPIRYRTVQLLVTGEMSHHEVLAAINSGLDIDNFNELSFSACTDERSGGDEGAVRITSNGNWRLPVVVLLLGHTNSERGYLTQRLKPYLERQLRSFQRDHNSYYNYIVGENGSINNDDSNDNNKVCSSISGTIINSINQGEKDLKNNFKEIERKLTEKGKNNILVDVVISKVDHDPLLFVV